MLIKRTYRKASINRKGGIEYTQASTLVKEQSKKTWLKKYITILLLILYYSILRVTILALEEIYIYKPKSKQKQT